MKREQLHLETYAVVVCVGANLLQVMDGMQFPGNKAPNSGALWPIAFTSKSLTSAETYYSTMERKLLGILHGLEKIHHYYFTHGVNMTTDH